VVTLCKVAFVHTGMLDVGDLGRSRGRDGDRFRHHAYLLWHARDSRALASLRASEIAQV
jgi:hypothetical protein